MVFSNSLSKCHTALERGMYRSNVALGKPHGFNQSSDTELDSESTVLQFLPSPVFLLIVTFGIESTPCLFALLLC